MRRLICTLLLLSLPLGVTATDPSGPCIDGNGIWSLTSTAAKLFVCTNKAWVLSNTRQGTWTPALSSSGGTLPTFTDRRATFTQVGTFVHFQVFLSNLSGGTPGNGNQQLSITLPFNTLASQLPIRIPLGTAINSSTDMTVYGTFPDGVGNTILLWRFGSSSVLQPLANNDFLNANRQLALGGNILVGFPD